MRLGTECRGDEVRPYRSGVCGRLTRVMAASVLGVEEVDVRSLGRRGMPGGRVHAGERERERGH